MHNSLPPVDQRITPMIAQYIEIKAANPGSLLFYRMGDFYELFFQDAEIASRALGIVLTKRGRHMGEDIRMCGVPIDRADDYLSRLIGLGHRVAVCEQMEDPAEAKKRGAKSVVKRDVVRLVTPGTITEERLLEPARANMLTAIARVRSGDESFVYGIASADISTGSFHLSQASQTGLLAEIARIEPREIVAPVSLCDDPELHRLLAQTGAPLTPMGREVGDSIVAERRLRDYFGVATIEGFGAFSRAEIFAAATLLAYIEMTQIGSRPPLSRPTRTARGAIVEIDAATRANLELTRTLSGARAGSLVDNIDACMTPAGSRLLAERLAAPLTDPVAINQRFDAIACLLSENAARAELRASLKRVPDMARALSRLALQRGGPRDLKALRDGLQTAREIAAGLVGIDAAIIEVHGALIVLAGDCGGLEQVLADALAEELPLKARDGGFIRAGYDANLDEFRALRDESRRVIAELQGRYAQEAETRQLKIKHNNFLGFFIEVPQALGERLLRPPFDTTYIHRQTMADAMRFSTRDLAELESRIASAADRALALEQAIFERLLAAVLAQENAIKQRADALAVLDVTAALAEIAQNRDWVRPTIDRSMAFVIEAGRHPVVEAALTAQGQAFVANPCTLSDTSATKPQIAILTGPNMAGKSTFLRQNALIVLLAQMGCFVPARRAHIGIVDRLFSRVGAADDLARGRSTFMVEMVETAVILNQATAHSLVILDEIGRGTATFDGLSIAWAAMEYLHDTNGSRALFATHFHELTQLTKKLPRLVNLTMRVTDWNGEVVFLHEVAPGAADRSYGIQVAKLAGLPAPVVERARILLAELEAGDRRAPLARTLADLPLFAAALPPPPPAKTDLLAASLDAIYPDDLTPRAALEALYRLKRLRAGDIPA